MSSGIYSALSGAVAQERNLSVVANNMANINTTGYKADKTAFEVALMQPADGNRMGAASMKFAELKRSQADLSLGPLTETGNSLDLALLDQAMFSVRTEDGIRYTRAGSFVRDAEGVVRTHAGDPLLLEGGEGEEGTELVIPKNAQEIGVAPDGTVSADRKPLGVLRLRTFESGSELSKVGQVYFRPEEGVTPRAPEEVQILQGSLEQANIGAVQGMQQVVMANRAFDALQQMIQSFRDADRQAARGFGG